MNLKFWTFGKHVRTKQNHHMKHMDTSKFGIWFFNFGIIQSQNHISDFNNYLKTQKTCHMCLKQYVFARQLNCQNSKILPHSSFQVQQGNNILATKRDESKCTNGRLTDLCFLISIWVRRYVIEMGEPKHPKLIGNWFDGLLIIKLFAWQ